MVKKALVPLALTIGMVLAPAAAWANHCANLSRGAGNAVPFETVRGRWFLVDAGEDVGLIWVFQSPENFHNGRSDGLLDGSGACNASRLRGHTRNFTSDTVHGIWSEECFNDALADAGIG